MITLREMHDELLAYKEEKSKEFKGQAWKKKYPMIETEQDINRYIANKVVPGSLIFTVKSA